MIIRLFRAGRSLAVTGVRGQADVYYFGFGEWRSLEDERCGADVESDI